MTFDWNAAFKQAGQVTSADEAASLLNTIGSAAGLLHFRLEDSNVVLSGSVGSHSPSPLRAEAAVIFEKALDEQLSTSADRLLSTNVPFWLTESWNGNSDSSVVPPLLFCPLRYGKSEETVALFLAESEQLNQSGSVFLQSCLVRILERLMTVGILLKQKSQPLGDDEKRCLDMYSKGHSISQISTELDLPEQVVVATMNTARNRLFANNLTHAIAVAIRTGAI